MELEWENVANYSDQKCPFEQQQYQDLEEELLCLDSVPPSLFDVDDLLINPPPLHLDHHHHHHDLVTPINNNNHKEYPVYPYLDFPPPLLLSPEENFPFEEDYYTQILPCSKKQRFLLPCFDGFVPEFMPEITPIPHCGTETGMGTQTGTRFGCWDISETRNDNCLKFPCITDYQNNNNINGDYVNDYNGGNEKGREVSAQSKAARERRRKITQKTQELGKLVPGGNKMNTAEMLQAAFKYVKFLQAQLGILQSMKTLQEESDKKINLNNLPILASNLIQEKLYTEEKCLVPLDFLPLIEEHHEFDTTPPI